MATGTADDKSTIYQTPESPGDAERLRQDGVASPDRHDGSAPPADGSFLGNVHKGTSVDPDAYTRSAAIGGDHAPAVGDGSELVVPADGVRLDIPQIPAFGGVSITVEISGVPESVILSSGRSQASGIWRLDRTELDEVFLLPANEAAEATLGEPLSLNVDVIVVDIETGAESRTSTVIDVIDVNEAPVSASIDGPAVPAGAVLHLDAADLDANGNPDDNPADGSQVARWKDSSGNNHDAEQRSAAPVFAEGSINGIDAVDFSGSNDAMLVPNSRLINTRVHPERSFAISFEAGGDVSGFQVVYEQGGSVQGYSLAIAEDPANGGQPTLWGFAYSTRWAPGDQYKAINLGVVEPGASYNVVMVHDASAADIADRTFTAYVNGDHRGTLTHADLMPSHSGSITIGGHGDATIHPVAHNRVSGKGGDFEGSVGELIIWNGALDPQQVSETASYLSEKWAGAPLVMENAPDGTTVFHVRDVVDPDSGDSHTFSLADDANGRFAVNSATGEVYVANSALLDHAGSHTHDIVVRVTDSGGEFVDVPVSVAVGDANESLVGAIGDADTASDGVSESAAVGDSVGITVFASDGDPGDTVTYSLLDDAGGRFAIDVATGDVTVADPALLDHESDQSHTITVQAVSSDGSKQIRDFTIAIGDDNTEFSITGLTDSDTGFNTVSESAASGDSVGLTAFAEDGDGSDTVTYSLLLDADGRFKIDATTGEVTVDDAALLDHETHQSHAIVVKAQSSDGSATARFFFISVGDDTSEFSVSGITDSDSAADSVSEIASSGDSVGIAAFAEDGDRSDTVTYSLTNDANGRFKIDATTGEITVDDAALLDHETADSHTITVRAQSSDGSIQTHDFTIAVGDENEAPTALTLTKGDTYGDAVAAHAPVAHWRLDDASGSSVAADAMGNHDGSYEQGANHGNGSGPFARIQHSAASFDGANDFIEVPNSPSFDLPEGTIQAWFKVDAFGRHDHTIFSMDSSGTDDGSVYLAVDGNRGDVEFYIEDSSRRGGLNGSSNAYLLSGNNSVQEGQWHHVAVTFGPGGMVMYLDGVEVASDPHAGGIGNADDEPITIGASQRYASTEGQALPGQLDRFFDGQIAEVALYGTALSAVELAALADSGINGYDIPGDTIAEGAQNGTVVGIVEARDPDSGESFTYGLLDDAGGRFAIDGTTGEISVLDGSKLDYETARQHTVTVQVTDSGGLSYSDSFVINLVDIPDMSGPGTMVGTDTSEVMTGTNLSEGGGGEEIILGMGGDDRLEGHGNEDRLVGGEGDDSLSGGSGDDILIGGAGNDVSEGGSGNDAFVFRMGDGNDTVSGGTGTDAIVLMGADGGVPVLTDWSLNLTTGSATWSTDQVTLTPDATGTITFTDGSSIAFDSIERIDFSGDYLVDGGRGVIEIAASSGETIVAGNTEDTLIGGIGADILSGGSNEDLLLGNEGADNLSGGDHNDVLYGGSGADTLGGDAGDDILVGGDGDDILTGGLGNDSAFGGAGDDTYVFGDGDGSDSFDGGGGSWTDTVQLSGRDGLAAYNGWTVTGVTITSSGNDFIELADDSDGTITLDDGSELTFTDVDRIEW